jgi:hypothetical protein
VPVNSSPPLGGLLTTTLLLIRSSMVGLANTSPAAGQERTGPGGQTVRLATLLAPPAAAAACGPPLLLRRDCKRLPADPVQPGSGGSP